MRFVFLAAALVAASTPTLSQEWVMGAGFADFSNSLSEDGGIVSMEYQHTPFQSSENFDLRWGGVMTVHRTGILHLGGGFIGTYQLQNTWFIESSVMPGAFFEHDAKNDLGSTFEIRSLIAIGHRFGNDSALSLALTHKSNASTAAQNPGVNALVLRWHLPFDR